MMRNNFTNSFFFLSLLGLSTSALSDTNSNIFLEAEDQTWDKATVDANHSGYTGTGFLNTVNKKGTNVYFQVEIDAPGQYEIAFRYAHATEHRNQAVYVNGNLAQDIVAFPPTQDWTNWSDATLVTHLSRGTNSIRLMSLTSGGAPNLDSATIKPIEGRAFPTSGLQAEDPVWFEQQGHTWANAYIDNYFSGYLGDGYVKLTGGSESSMTWGIAPTTSPSTRVKIRYANGAEDCLVDVYSSGELVQAKVNFRATGAWSNWAEQSFFLNREHYHSLEMTTSETCGDLLVDGMTWRLTQPTKSDPIPFSVQAEDQSWDAGSLGTQHAGYTGTSYLDTENAMGTSVYWNVVVPNTADYEVTVNYSHATDDRPQSIYVNGEMVLPSVPFNKTNRWIAWEEQAMRLPLQAGGNIIEMKSLTAGGAPNLDKMTIEGQYTGTITLQAEQQGWDKATVDSNHGGFNGTGFLNTENEIGTKVNWLVALPHDGQYQVSIRYAHAYQDRPQEIVISSDQTLVLPFAKTGGWNQWQEETFTATLRQGQTQITMKSLVSGGAPNLDQMTITPISTTGAPVGSIP